MDMKQAARTAKKYLTDLLSDEEISNVGVEEVEFDESAQEWRITVGFSRPWDRKNAVLTALGEERHGRAYKVIRIDYDDGEVMSVRDRVLPASA